MKIPELFTDSEISCKCGCGAMPQQSAVNALYALRIILDQPIIITSGARCSVHNLSVGGKPGSYHLTGEAFDIRILPDYVGLVMFDLAPACGFTGIAYISPGSIHLDTGHLKLTTWGY